MGVSPLKQFVVSTKFIVDPKHTVLKEMCILLKQVPIPISSRMTIFENEIAQEFIRSQNTARIVIYYHIVNILHISLLFPIIFFLKPPGGHIYFDEAEMNMNIYIL